MIKFRDLEKVRFIVKEATGLEIMYTYDDLVFPEFGAFLLRFDDENPERLFCHFQTDCKAADKTKLFNALKESGKTNSLLIKMGNDYRLSKKNDEELEIKFS